MVSPQPRLVGRQFAPGGRLYLADPDRLADWPETLDAPDRPFIAFVAMDSGDVRADELYTFAERLLDQGSLGLYLGAGLRARARHVRSGAGHA